MVAQLKSISPTRRLKTLNLCFGNIKDAYKGFPKPTFRGSDHNVILFVKQYNQKLSSRKPETKTIKR